MRWMGLHGKIAALAGDQRSPLRTLSTARLCGKSVFPSVSFTFLPSGGMMRKTTSGGTVMKKRTRIKLKRFFVKLLIWIGCSAASILICTLLWFLFDTKDGGIIDDIIMCFFIGLAIGLCRRYDLHFVVKVLGEEEVVRILEDLKQDE
jgi:hypothetical protein